MQAGTTDARQSASEARSGVIGGIRVLVEEFSEDEEWSTQPEPSQDELAALKSPLPE